MAFTFTAAVAYDPASNKPVKNASFQVYAVTDTAFLTPLAITDAFGAPLPSNILNSGSQGVFPQFQQATNATVVIADSTKTYVWTVNCVQQDAAIAAFINTTGSASAVAVKSEVTTGATATALNVTYAQSKSARSMGGRFVFLGDSITIAGDTVSGSTLQTLDSFALYFTLLSQGKVHFVRNAGHGGNTTADMLARFDTDVTPYGPAVVPFQAGSNDFTFGVTDAQFRANVKAIVAKIRAIGASPILLTMPPVNGAGASQKQQIMRNNMWLCYYCDSQGIPIIDMWGIVADPQTGNYLAAMDNGDGIHPSVTGRFAIGQALAAQIGPLLTTTPLVTRNAVDPLNIIPNGLMQIAPSLVLGATAASGGTFAAGTYYWKITGTGSTPESGGSNEVTATLALNGTQTLSWPGLPAFTGYKVYRGTAPGAENVLVATLGNVTSYTDTGTAGSAASVPANPTIAPNWAVSGSLPTGASTSIVTDSNVPGNMQRISLSSTTGAATIRTAPAVGSGFSVGDVLRYSAVVTNNQVRLQMAIQNLGGTSQLNFAQFDKSLTRGTLVVQDFTVPVGTTNILCDITARDAGFATTGTADFGQVTIYNLTTGALLTL